MSVANYVIHDRLNVPAALAAAHATLPQQSICVLHANCSNELKLIRLFLGNVGLEHLPTGHRWLQANNYSVVGPPRVAFRTPAHVAKLLLPFGIAIEDVDKHLRSTLQQGGYYAELLAEVLNYLYRTNRGEHTVGFLHLYRFLEHISLAFPILYAARTTNFTAAFTALKDFFDSTVKRELRLFEKFVQNAIDQPTRDQKVRIRFHTVVPGIVAKVYSVTKRQLNAADISSEVVDTHLDVRCEALTGALHQSTE